MKHPSYFHLRLLFFLLLCIGGSICLIAQDFRVRTFRMLPNDISAYIDPVRDLNDEACALVKIVGDKDFVFSTPLGIVKRKNDVGEIWLYVPQGTVLLTLKHPRWGVLRDYRFPTALESRMTYELVVESPPDHRWSKKPTTLVASPHPLDTTLHATNPLPVPEPPTPRRPVERLHYLALLNMGFHGKHPSVGIRLALMRRHGAYLLAQTDFHATPHTAGECDRNGNLPDGGTPYYTGETQDGRWMILAGGIHRLVHELCLYEGIGYGQHNTAWEQHDGIWLRNKDLTHRGVSAEAGLLYRFYRIAVSAGVQTIQGKYWEASVGIGVHF